jgi:hypothetical protein
VRDRHKGRVRGESSGERAAEDLSSAHIGKRATMSTNNNVFLQMHALATYNPASTRCIYMRRACG